jgi:hypothetical protein
MTAIIFPLKGPDLRLGLFRRLGPKFHHDEHKPVKTNHKDNNNAGISPSIIFLFKVEGPEVIATLGILTHTTSVGVLWVQEVYSRAHALLVNRKVFLAGLVRGRVEYSKFTGFAADGLIPGSEDEQRTHEVVERIEVVDPVK